MRQNCNCAYGWSPQITTDPQADPLPIPYDPERIVADEEILVTGKRKIGNVWAVGFAALAILLFTRSKARRR
jgi:hypothetical protein